jgi:hypothetical protein
MFSLRWRATKPPAGRLPPRWSSATASSDPSACCRWSKSASADQRTISPPSSRARNSTRSRGATVASLGSTLRASTGSPARGIRTTKPQHERGAVPPRIDGGRSGRLVTSAKEQLVAIWAGKCAGNLKLIAATGDPRAPAFYVIGAAVISGTAPFWLRDRHGGPLQQ